MPAKPPSFGSQAYWDKRFTSNANPFDWLDEPNALDPYLLDALDSCRADKPEILHIGCGTSLLSFHLRSHVERPGRIHNLDYSDVAIQIGRAREEEIYQCESEQSRGTTGAADTRCMRWDVVDLLDYKSVLRTCRRASYAIVVDKSTADAIACCDDIPIPLPYPIAIRSYDPVELDSAEPNEPIHPLAVMAVNLALVTKPGARWIALSYSKERFDILDTSSDVVPKGIAFPHPADLWRLVQRCEIDDVAWPTQAEKKDESVHRPKVCNTVYVLERTDTPLFIRGEHI